MKTTDDDHLLWELAEFCARESLLLRSFLEYLRTFPDPPEKKLARLEQWRGQIGLQLGNPGVSDQASQIFRTIRDAPPETRHALLQKALQEMAASYF